MTTAHAPFQIAAHSSFDATASTALALARRGMGVLSHGWRFAEACCRTSGYRDDGAPTCRFSPAILERANAEVSVR